MALLSLSNHSIVSYGTFGMWGALLSGRGETVLPKDITLLYAMKPFRGSTEYNSVVIFA